MLFNSLAFLGFFAVFYPLYLLTCERVGLQNRLLLVASCVFYGWWDWRFLALMFYTIIIDYFISHAIAATADEQRRTRLVQLSVFSNLSVLGFFKYFGFFTDSAVAAAGALGIELSPFTLNVVLPVGISFYTFQSLSYVVDVRRRQLEPAPRLLDYAAYVSLFPQLVAGPIERGVHLLPQILQRRRVVAEQVYEGSYLILWGLFKKIFIADNLARIVDPVYSHPDPSAAAIVVATYAFAFQIYCDFSAYSDIARGLGKMMGFDILINFNLPYFARNPSEFWRKWHISLSSWLRDYLYIGLGGNRNGTWSTYRNLGLTMVLGGLWHGAAWNFVLWGAYQGLLLIVHRLCQARLAALEASLPAWSRRVWGFVCMAVFFQFVCFGWLLFRATSGEQVVGMSVGLFGFDGASEVFGQLARTIFYVAPLLAVQVLQYRTGDLLALYRLPVPVRVFAYCAMVVAILSFGVHDASEFIYFQF